MADADDPRDRALPSSFDDNREFYEREPVVHKIARKVREEPLIPIGLGLTVAALFNAFRASRRGDSATVQRMFRARVGAQGFTVLAMMAGGVYYGKDRQRTAELHKMQQERDNEEKRVRWIKELEARDDEEKALKKRAEARKAAQQAGAKVAMQSLEGGAPKPTSGGMLGSLGVWRGRKSPGAGEQQTAAVAEDGAVRKRKENPRSSLPDLTEIMSSKKSSAKGDEPEGGSSSADKS